MDSQELKLFLEDSDEVEHDDEGEEEEEKAPVGKKRKVPVIDDVMKLKGLKHWLDFANNPLAKERKGKSEEGAFGNCQQSPRTGTGKESASEKNGSWQPG